MEGNNRFLKACILLISLIITALVSCLGICNGGHADILNGLRPPPNFDLEPDEEKDQNSRSEGSVGTPEGGQDDRIYFQEGSQPHGVVNEDNSIDPMETAESMFPSWESLDLLSTRLCLAALITGLVGCIFLMLMFIGYMTGSTIKIVRVVTRICRRSNKVAPLPPAIAHELKDLPTRTWPTESSSSQNKIPEGEVKCSICLDTFKSSDVLRVLPCNHEFHKNCVDPWLQESSRRCPNCNQPVAINSQGNIDNCEQFEFDTSSESDSDMEESEMFEERNPPAPVESSVEMDEMPPTKSDGFLEYRAEHIGVPVEFLREMMREEVGINC